MGKLFPMQTLSSLFLNRDDTLNTTRKALLEASKRVEEAARSKGKTEKTQDMIRAEYFMKRWVAERQWKEEMSARENYRRYRQWKDGGGIE